MQEMKKILLEITFLATNKKAYLVTIFKADKKLQWSSVITFHWV